MQLDDGSVIEVAPAASMFARSRARWTLALMLLALHAAVAWGIDQAFSRSLMLAHFGLFLLWQPLWAGQAELARSQVLLLIVASMGFALALDWWLLTLWIAILVAMLGGNLAGAARRQRWPYLIAVFYLLSLLLVVIVPELIGENHTMRFLPAAQWLLGVLPLAILLPKDDPAAAHARSPVDFFYSLMLFLLVLVLVLGSFVIKVISRGNYYLALAESLFVLAGLLALLGWLWYPRAGFAGFGQLLSRYVLTIGLPFERWLQNLALTAEEERDARAFLQAALDELATLDWIVGGHVAVGTLQQDFGTRTGYAANFSFHDFDWTIYARHQLSPALILHIKLLTQLIAYFYEAKRREQVLKDNAYAQAIYETGARLTHDIKNLLQSLNGLCAAAGDSPPGQAEDLQRLIQRQLPQITQRLRNTLEKLRAPQIVDHTLVPSADWWQTLAQRYDGQNVAFIGTAPRDEHINSELFDSVADNLLQNALRKRSAQTPVAVRIELLRRGGLGLRVCDDGEAVPAGLAEQLFGRPVASQSGLGIGLYQASAHARQHGYELNLTENRGGAVCFELTKLDREPQGLI